MCTVSSTIPPLPSSPITAWTPSVAALPAMETQSGTATTVTMVQWVPGTLLVPAVATTGVEAAPSKKHLKPIASLNYRPSLELRMTSLDQFGRAWTSRVLSAKLSVPAHNPFIGFRLCSVNEPPSFASFFYCICNGLSFRYPHSTVFWVLLTLSLLQASIGWRTFLFLFDFCSCSV